jgi:hypothetical protein
MQILGIFIYIFACIYIYIHTYIQRAAPQESEEEVALRELQASMLA